MTASVLLTVSGSLSPDVASDVAAGRRPRPDYVALADALGADLIDHDAAERGRLSRLAARLVGSDIVLAWACFRRRKRYATVFTDGEQVGMPFAALCWLVRRRPRHVMIGHLLSPRKKLLVHRALHLRRNIDRVVVYASAQRDLAIGTMGYPPDHVTLTTFMVDTEFWSADRVTPRPGTGRWSAPSGWSSVTTRR